MFKHKSLNGHHAVLKVIIGEANRISQSF
jgi:hypothetical protein